VPDDQTTRDVFTVLLVCTGNICRSALAERLGRAHLDEVLRERAGLVQLRSAGTRAVVGSGMHPDSALVLQGLGGEPGDFVARQFEPAHAAGADLILTMTRGHRRDVLQTAPRALARTFTLREAASLVAFLGDVQLEGADLPTRARDLVKEMATARAQHRSNGGDDILDPINRPMEVHQEAGELVAAALLPLLGRIADLANVPDVPADDGRDTARIRPAS
jgi:protein-tyrosine-phosphatase